MISFEDKIDEIEELLIKNRNRWQLDVVAWMDYDDVCQIIRIHISNKWNLWDQARPFKPWCNSVIYNQIFNQIRNNYSNYAKPCIKCEFNAGGIDCTKTKSEKQDSSCPIFAKWEKGKKNAYDIKLPVNIEDTPQEMGYENSTFLDYEASAEDLHFKVLEQLSNDRHRQAYRLLFIEGRSDEYVANELKFKEDPTNERRSKRFKQINNLKKKFYEIAKDILSKEDIAR